MDTKPVSNTNDEPSDNDKGYEASDQYSPDKNGQYDTFTQNSNLPVVNKNQSKDQNSDKLDKDSQQPLTVHQLAELFNKGDQANNSQRPQNNSKRAQKYRDAAQAQPNLNELIKPMDDESQNQNQEITAKDQKEKISQDSQKEMVTILKGLQDKQKQSQDKSGDLLNQNVLAGLKQGITEQILADQLRKSQLSQELVGNKIKNNLDIAIQSQSAKKQHSVHKVGVKNFLKRKIATVQTACDSSTDQDDDNDENLVYVPKLLRDQTRKRTESYMRQSREVRKLEDQQAHKKVKKEQDISNLREENDLLKIKDFTARQYVNKIAYDIDLNQLYKIHSASNFSHFDRYSAVLLNLGNKMRKVKIPSNIIDRKVKVDQSDLKSIKILEREILDCEFLIQDKKIEPFLVKLSKKRNPPTIIRKCFETLYFLFYKITPSWQEVIDKLRNETKEFISHMSEQFRDEINEAQMEILKLFTNHHDCSLQKVSKLSKEYAPFCYWVHYVSQIAHIKWDYNLQDLRQKFLMQVWSKQGICIYELPLNKPILHWNLFGDNFLFMEDMNAIKMLKCTQTSAELFTYSFVEKAPTQLVPPATKVNYQFEGFAINQGSESEDLESDANFNPQDLNEQERNSIIETKRQIESTLKQIRDDYKKNSDSIIPKDINLKREDTKGARKIIEQLHPTRTLGLYQDKLFMFRKDGDSTHIEYWKIDLKNSHNHIHLPRDSAKKVNHRYSEIHWHMICDQGDGEVLLIAEDYVHNNKLLFYNVSLQNQNREFFLCQRGPIPTNLNEELQTLQNNERRATLVKRPIESKSGKRNKQEKTEDIDSEDVRMPRISQLKVVFYPDQNGNYFMTALAIREEISPIKDQPSKFFASSYADCVQMDCWKVTSPEANYKVLDVEIGTDLNYYLIRAQTFNNRAAAGKKLKEINQKCKISVRGLIGNTNFLKCKNAERLDLVLHLRISRYFQLYTGLLHAGTNFLVAHGKCITMYDLRTSDQLKMYCGTKAFDSKIVGLAQVEMDKTQFQNSLNQSKKPDFSSNIVLITQDNTIRFLQPKGRKLAISTRQIQVCAKGTFYRIIEDQYTNQAIFIQNTQKMLFVYTGGDDVQRLTFKDHEITKDSKLYCMPIQDDALVSDVEKGPVEIVSELILQQEDVSTFFQLQKQGGVLNQQFQEISSVKHHQHDNGSLIYAFKINGNAFSEYRNWIITITTTGISVYNSKNELQSLHYNVGPTKTIHLSEHHLVILAQEQQEEVVKLTLTGKSTYKEEKTKIRCKRDGIYLVDIGSLLKSNNLIVLKLSSASSGAKDIIDFGSESQRLSFFTSWTRLTLLSFPHTNSIYFLGMRPKKDYLIWRQKNGFFCALDKKGVLSTWSMATGDLLYQKHAGRNEIENTQLPRQNSDKNVNEKTQSPTYDFNVDIDGWEPFQANKSDTNYLKQNYQLPNFTIQLLRDKNHRKEVSSEFKQKSEKKGNKVIDEFCLVEYRFKVLKLQLHQDVDHRHQMLKNEVLTEEFNFLFTMQEKRKIQYSNQPHNLNDNLDLQGRKSANDASDNGVHLNDNDIAQNRIFISDNTKYMMLLQQEHYSEFYERTEPHPLTGEVEWMFRFKIDQYPMLLQGRFSMRFLFSPNFHYYLTLQTKDMVFIIRSTQFAKQPLLQRMSVKEMFGQISHSRAQSLECIKELIKSFHFVDENCYRVINNEGIDCLINFRNGRNEIVSYAKRDNWNQERSGNQHTILGGMITDDKSDKNLLDRMMVSVNELKEKKAIMQYQETSQGLRIPRFKKLILPHQKVNDFYFHNRNVLDQIYTIDHSQPWESENSYFVCNQTFTATDWTLIEHILNNQGFGYQHIPEELFLRLFFNVLPGQNTFLHKLVMREDSIGIQVMMRGFKLAEKQDVELPITRDAVGMTPLDYVLEIKNMQFKMYQQPRIIEQNQPDPSYWDRFVIWVKSHEQHKFYGNTIMASKLLEAIQDYSFLHCGNQLSQAVVEAIKRQVPHIDIFLSNRCIASQNQLFGTFGDLRLTKKWYNSFSYEPSLMQQEDNEIFELNYSCCELDVWSQHKIAQDRLFLNEGIDKKKRLFYFDIPLLHQQTNEGQALIAALNETDDVNIFKSFPVQMLINEHWKRTKFFLVAFSFMPFFCLMLLYIYWSLYFEGDNLLKQSEEHKSLAKFIKITILALWAYQFLLEAAQGFYFGLRYFLDGWKWMTNLSGIGILLSIILTTPDQDFTQVKWYLQWQEEGFITWSYFFYVMQAYIIFFLWIKLIYFLKLFRSTSYLVHAIVQVIIDMRYFITIFLLFVFAFAFTLIGVSISRYLGNTGEGILSKDSGAFGIIHQATRITYELSLGIYENNDDFQSIFGKLFFFITTFTQVVVLLNVLIAIVSNSYQAVADQEIIYTFKERVGLIFEWQNTLGHFVRSSKGHVSHSTLMFLAMQNEDISEDSWLSINTVPKEEQAAQIADNKDSDDEEIDAKYNDLTERLEEQINNIENSVMKHF